MKPSHLLWSLFITFISCNTCKNVDCPSPFDILYLELVSPNGHDLLNGAYKKYNLSDIKIFALDAQGNRIEAGISAVSQNVPNTIMYVYLRSNMQRSFLAVKDIITDTLDLDFATRDTRCCGKINTIHQITLNGVLVAEDNTTLRIIHEK